MTSVTLDTFEENLKQAYWAEASIKEMAIYNQNLQQAQMQARTSSLGHSQQRPQQQFQHHQRSQQQYQQQAKRPKAGHAAGVHCDHCGRQHPSVECRWLTGGCFECGLMGIRLKTALGSKDRV